MTQGRSPLAFFALVYLLSIPFWLIGALAPHSLLPGLPLSALAAACPAIAAVLLVYREARWRGVGALLRRAADARRIPPLWYAPILLLVPAIMIAAYAAMRASGVAVPEPQIALLPALALFAAFLVFGVLEELGWSGYAFDPLQARWGTWPAALVIGVVWAAWHIIALVQGGRAFDWIAWWVLGTIALRVLTVWIYTNSGKSVFAASLFHAVSNLSWQLFPIDGSHYDPRFVAPFEALAALIVVALWNARDPQKR